MIRRGYSSSANTISRYFKVSRYASTTTQRYSFEWRRQKNNGQQNCKYKNLMTHDVHKYSCRQFSSGSSTNEAESTPFNTSVKLKQRSRAAELCKQYYNHYIQHQQQTSSTQQITKPILPYDYFHKEVANRLVERLDDINTHGTRTDGFPLALEIGGVDSYIYDALIDGCGEDENELMLDSSEANVEYMGARGGVRKLVQMDTSSSMLHRDDAFSDMNDDETDDSKKTICETFKLQADIDNNKTPLPFPDGTFDLVMSSMAFHWINDLPYLLSEIERILKPDGCLLFALPGGNTLPELRSSLVLAELERTGGVSTHVGPYVDLSNIGSLLTGTKFQLPTIDIDDINIGYPNAMVLMEHLQRMGEGNACTNRRERVGLGTFLGAACLYRELYPAEENDPSEGIVASAQVIYGIAWKQHDSQQRPDDRGSATHSLTDIAVTKTTSSSHDSEDKS